MSDQLHQYQGRDFATDHYVIAKRIEVLRGMVVRAMRELRGKTIEIRRMNYATSKVETLETGLTVRSMLVCVAQFWADNAVDEVHFRARFSSTDVPRWPHVCAEPTTRPTRVDTCSHCSNIRSRLQFGYTEVIPAFEAWAIEGGDQNQDGDAAYRPIAIARFRDDGEIVVEQIGPLIRPWLDVMHERCEVRPVSDRVRAQLGDPGALPVVADMLQHEGDPRGELIAKALLGVDHAEEIAEHGRSWLGSLERFVPRSAVTYEHGVPVEIGIFIGDEGLGGLDEMDPMPWACAPRVRFLPTSQRFLFEAMAPIRALAGIDLYSLIGLWYEMQIETLEIWLYAGADIEPLDDVLPYLPKLRELVLVGPGATAAMIPIVRRIVPADLSLEVAAPHADAEAHVAELIAWGALGRRVTVSMFDTEAQRAAGWAVTIDGASISRTHRGFHREADDTRRWAIMSAFGDRTWVEFPSPTFIP